MKVIPAAMISLLLTAVLMSQPGYTTQERNSKPMQTPHDSRMVAPALEKYAEGALAELWKRPALTPRDRSIVTLVALIARNQND
jgi:4-carboxymuconolactone decarboxylase